MVLTRNELEASLGKEVRIGAQAERYATMPAEACGRSDPNSTNLWAGIDAPAA